MAGNTNPLANQTNPGYRLFLGSEQRRFFLSLVIGGVAWGTLLLWWIVHEPADAVVLRVPGMDGEPTEVSSRTTGEVRIGAFFELSEGVPASIQGVWPGFRGPGRDNIVRNTGSLRSSLSSPPPILWSIDLGEGHAAPSVLDGRVFLLDYDKENDADALRCLSLGDGKEIWRRWYGVKVKRNHGMSRTVPAVTDSFVVTIGPRCHVMCVRPHSGDLLWGIDLVKEYGTEVPMWYTGQCPLIDDTVAVIAPGGSSLMIGVDCRTGEVLWETPNPDGWKMSHSSVMPMDFGGRTMYVYCASGGLVGVAADGPDRGDALFATEAFNQSVVAPSPVALRDDRIFMTAGYGAGSMLFQVRETGGTFFIEPIDTIDVKEGPSSEQQTPLYHAGHLFMVLPKDAGEHRGQFVCVNPDNPREFVWTSGPQRRYGLGPYLLADSKFYLLNDDGTLTIAQFSTTRFKEEATVELIDGIDAWGPMALVGGRLLARDAGTMVCVDAGG